VKAATAATEVRRKVGVLWAATIFERTRNAGISDASPDDRIRWFMLVAEAHDLAEQASIQAERGCLDSAVVLASAACLLLSEAQQTRHQWTANR
jgi:hypothetical protein